MSIRTDSVAAELLLPLATGLLSQFRCIHVEVDAGGVVTTKIVKGGCDERSPGP